MTELDTKSKLRIALIILLILLPLLAYILYSPETGIISNDDDVEPDEDKKIKLIKFEEIDNFELENVNAIEVADGIAWIGSRNALYRYDLISGELSSFNQSQGLLSDAVLCIEVDNGIIWIGTNKGISIYNTSKQNWSNVTIQDGLGGNMIRDIIVDNNKVWVASQGTWQYSLKAPIEGGISCLDKKSDTWTVYNSSDGYLFDDAINTMTKDGDKIWIGGNYGLKLFNLSEKTSYIWNEETLNWNKSTDKYSHYDPPKTYSIGISAIALGQDEIIIGSYFITDVEIYNSLANNWTILKQDTPVFDIEIGNDYIYLGTENGVKIFDTSNNNWKVIDKSTGLLNNTVTDIEIYKDQLWVGSKEGINVYQIVIETVTKNN